MSEQFRVRVHWAALVAAAAVLVAVGAVAAYVALRPAEPPPPAAADRGTVPAAHAPAAGAAPGTAPRAGAPGPLPDVVVPIGEEAAERAGITAAAVTTGNAARTLVAPGVVEPNAYRLVAVTPLVSGRITRVMAELGQQVQRGQTIAQIFSPELAEAETRYVATRASFEAHEREVARTARLVEIGAASRQELERVHARHTAHRAELQSAASRLELLGFSASAMEALGPGTAINPTASVPAPMTGIVTERTANVGLNVDGSTKLFTVVDLSTVWLVADLFEQDFARIRVGTPATVTTVAYPDLSLEGRVGYIDPQVSPETRTAKVRIEVPNPRLQLRLGMYAQARFGGEEGGSTPMVPRGAVQHVGDRTVVYLVDRERPGRFIEREVRLGAPAGDQVPVLAGVQPGDVVVGEGSFHVRAERERLGLRPPMPAPTAGDAGRRLP